MSNLSSYKDFEEDLEAEEQLADLSQTNIAEKK